MCSPGCLGEEPRRTAVSSEAPAADSSACARFTGEARAAAPARATAPQQPSLAPPPVVRSTSGGPAAPAPPRAAKVTGEGLQSPGSPLAPSRLTARSLDQRSLTLGLFLRALSLACSAQARERKLCVRVAAEARAPSAYGRPSEVCEAPAVGDARSLNQPRRAS
ncbi:hypothetical protein MTO96_013962 [Rhipicephalus appendiculatus]